MEEGALTGVGSEQKVVPESDLKKAMQRIKRLERLLGRKTEEVECLKEAVRIGREKKLISHSPLQNIEGFE
jgi:transposase